MKHSVIKDLPSKEVAEGVTLRSVYLDNVMVTFVDFADGAVVPLHSHPHEQISVMIAGKLLFTVAGEERTLSAGEALLVPSGVEHSAVAADGPAVVYDCWNPIREDYVLDK